MEEIQENILGDFDQTTKHPKIFYSKHNAFVGGRERRMFISFVKRYLRFIKCWFMFFISHYVYYVYI